MLSTRPQLLCRALLGLLIVACSQGNDAGSRERPLGNDRPIGAIGGSDGPSNPSGNVGGTTNIEVPNDEPTSVGGGSGGECASVSQRAKSERRPVDIIFIIDNSRSMTNEIEQVQERINGDFAQIIESSGIDYRVIMISRYGSTTTDTFNTRQICVRAPLGSSDCKDPDNTPLKHNPPRFYHYSADVESLNGWCLLIDSWKHPDEFVTYAKRIRPWTPIAPNGWSEFARPQAFKNFVMISDDGISCSTSADKKFSHFRDVKAVAADFDRTLLALSVEQFGTAENRNYSYHAIVGLKENTQPSEPWPPTAPVQTEMCTGDVENPGTIHQELSILTGGLRYPVCRTNDYTAVFHALATDVITRSKLTCEWNIPAAPPGQSFDPRKVNLQYREHGEGELETILKAPSAAKCPAEGGWYYDQEAKPTKILSCPATCKTLQGDDKGEIHIAFGCETKIATVK